MSRKFINYQEEENRIEAFENNLFNDEMIGEIEVPMEGNRLLVLLDKKFVFGNSKYVAMVGSECYMSEFGTPEPDCSVAVIYKNEENIDYNNYLYMELQSSMDSAIYNFSNMYNDNLREIIKRDRARKERLQQLQMQMQNKKFA